MAVTHHKRFTTVDKDASYIPIEPIGETYRFDWNTGTRLLPDCGHFFFEQFEERFEGDRRFLLAPYGDKVNADVVGLQAVKEDAVRAQVAGRCGDNGYPFLGFDSGKHGMHIVQLIVHAWREAVVILIASS
jgi:hypothetical protein